MSTGLYTLWEFPSLWCFDPELVSVDRSIYNDSMKQILLQSQITRNILMTSNRYFYNRPSLRHWNLNSSHSVTSQFCKWSSKVSTFAKCAAKDNVDTSCFTLKQAQKNFMNSEQQQEPICFPYHANCGQHRLRDAGGQPLDHPPAKRKFRQKHSSGSHLPLLGTPLQPKTWWVKSSPPWLLGETIWRGCEKLPQTDSNQFGLLKNARTSKLANHSFVWYHINGLVWTCKGVFTLNQTDDIKSNMLWW